MLKCCCRRCWCWQVQDDVQSVFHCVVWSVSLLFSLPFLTLCHPRLVVESLRPSLHRGLLQPLSLAARQTLRLPLTLRMLDPSSIRIHHDLLHHVMCLLDTSLSSHVEFLLSSPFSPTHSFCVHLTSSYSCSPCHPCFFLLSCSRLLRSPFFFTLSSELLLLNALLAFFSLLCCCLLLSLLAVPLCSSLLLMLILSAPFCDSLILATFCILRAHLCSLSSSPFSSFLSILVLCCSPLPANPPLPSCFLFLFLSLCHFCWSRPSDASHLLLGRTPALPLPVLNSAKPLATSSNLVPCARVSDPLLFLFSIRPANNHLLSRKRSRKVRIRRVAFAQQSQSLENEFPQ